MAIQFQITLAVVFTLLSVRTSSADLWQFSFTGDLVHRGEGIPTDVFSGVDLDGPLGSFIYSSVVDDSNPSFFASKWEQWYLFDVVSAEISYQGLSMDMMRPNSYCGLSTINVCTLWFDLGYVSPAGIPFESSLNPINGMLLSSGQVLDISPGLGFTSTNVALTLIPGPTATPLIALAALMARRQRCR